MTFICQGEEGWLQTYCLLQKGFHHTGTLWEFLPFVLRLQPVSEIKNEMYASPIDNYANNHTLKLTQSKHPLRLEDFQNGDLLWRYCLSS